MTQKNNGGPAFPNKEFKAKRLSYDEASSTYELMGPHPGMTLRDYFAAHAAGQVMYASTTTQGDWEPQVVAKCAYEIADAMLAERTK